MFTDTNYTLNCGGRLLNLDEPCVMGILNITPDSFFDGGKYIEADEILKQCRKMIDEGAAIIDVGAYSSRPGAVLPGEETESNRLMPVIDLLKQQFPNLVISVDTFRSNIAAKAIAAGAHIINDITAGNGDPQMFNTIAQLQVPYILMHMQGMPYNMQDNPHYDNVVMEVLDFFAAKIAALRALGVHDIVIDPGFGFGKTVEHNYTLLNGLNIMQLTGLPVLAGVSRKSMICKVLEVNPAGALNGTSVLNTLALLNGAKILRVHDVKEAIQCIKLVKKYKTQSITSGIN